MAPKKPVTNIDILGNLDLSPEKHVAFYRASKFHEKYLLKPPNWDSAGDSVELLAIQNVREYQDMLKEQKEVLDCAKLQSVINSHRIREVCQAHNNLRVRFADLNVFMKESNDKKLLAQKEVKKEQQKHQTLHKSIKELRDQIAVMADFKVTLLKVIKEFEPYETVINEVVKINDTWETVKDCTDRCDALMLTQVEISIKGKQAVEMIEKRRQDMIRLSNEASLTVLGYINQLSNLGKDYDKSRSDCLKWEKILVNTKNLIAEANLHAQMTQDGIWWIYKLLCRRSGVEVNLRKEQTEEQMNFIKEEIELLQTVVYICEEHRKKKLK